MSAPASALQRGLSAAAVAAALTSVGTASAQNAARAARDAFTAGLAAEGAGRADEACASFRKSLALVRELGPLQKAAACDERDGKLRSASALLEELLSRLPPGDAERAPIEERLRVARSGLGLITIVVRADAPAGLRLRIDGTAVSLPTEDVIVDPGRREIVVEVPGRGVERTEVDVIGGGRAKVTIPSETPGAAPPPATIPPGEAGGDGHALGTAGWILGGVGVAGFVGVAVTGVALLGKSSDFDACAGGVGCEAQVSDEASPLVAVNTVMWAVGIAGVGLGATFILVDAGSNDGPTASAHVSPAGAAFRGRF